MIAVVMLAFSLRKERGHPTRDPLVVFKNSQRGSAG